MEYGSEYHWLANEPFLREADTGFVRDDWQLYRSGRPYYSLRWYLDSSFENNWEGENPYTIVAQLDANSGKLMALSIEAAGTRDADVVYEVKNQTEYTDPVTGSTEIIEEVWPYHENFHDIFPEGMTINGFCDLLNMYWGFDGWTLGGGGALNTAVPLQDITGGTHGNYYVVFNFKGDEEGKHMYVQLGEVPGRICLLFGTYRMVG